MSIGQGDFKVDPAAGPNQHGPVAPGLCSPSQATESDYICYLGLRGSGQEEGEAALEGLYAAVRKN